MAKAEKLTLVFLIVATAGRLRLELGPHLVQELGKAVRGLRAGRHAAMCVIHAVLSWAWCSRDGRCVYRVRSWAALICRQGRRRGRSEAGGQSGNCGWGRKEQGVGGWKGWMAVSAGAGGRWGDGQRGCWTSRAKKKVE